MQETKRDLKPDVDTALARSDCQRATPDMIAKSIAIVEHCNHLAFVEHLQYAAHDKRQLVYVLAFVIDNVTPAEGCVGLSSISLRSAQEGECTNETYRPKKRTRRMLSLANSDDSDDESSFENVMRCCVVSVRRSNDNESADVICDSARFCCSCFVTGSCVNFICIGGL